MYFEHRLLLLILAWLIAAPPALAEDAAVPPLLARPKAGPVAAARVPTEIENKIDLVSDALTLTRLAKQFELEKDWRHQAYALQKLFALRPMQGPIGYELAAAYARAGRFSEAVETQRHAIELLEAKPKKPAQTFLQSFRDRLERYERSEPVVVPSEPSA